MKQREKGFSLLEVLIALAIAACIIVPITVTTTLIVKSFRQDAVQNTVLPQVQNVGYWISRDVQIASGITLGDPNGNGFPLSLDIPTDVDPNNDYGIEYFFDGNKLKRKVYDSSQTLVSETFIADHIDTDNTTFSLVDDATPGHYRLTVTASGDVAGATKIYEIKQRISLSYYY